MMGGVEERSCDNLVGLRFRSREVQNRVRMSVRVTGALCRKTDSKIATAPKTQSRSKDQNKEKDNSK